MGWRPAIGRRFVAGSIVKVKWGLRQGKYGIVLYSYKSKSDGEWVYRVKYSGQPGFTYETGRCYEYESDLQLVRKPSIVKKVLGQWRKAIPSVKALLVLVGQFYMLLHDYPLACWLTVAAVVAVAAGFLFAAIRRMVWGDLFISGL